MGWNRFWMVQPNSIGGRGVHLTGLNATDLVQTRGLDRFIGTVNGLAVAAHTFKAQGLTCGVASVRWARRPPAP